MRLNNKDNSKSILLETTENRSYLHLLSNGNVVGWFHALEDGQSEIGVNKLNNLRISWEYSDELGKFVLCGE